MIAFIDEHRVTLSVEPICRTLQIASSTCRAHFVRRHDPQKGAARSRRDAELRTEINRVYQVNFEVCGARKTWRTFGRDRIEVTRCAVERLTHSLGIQGAVRGKVAKTSVREKSTSCPADRVNRQFHTPRPNVLWVSDFTRVSTWKGFVAPRDPNHRFNGRHMGKRKT